jgi:hypothetical protein
MREFEVRKVCNVQIGTFQHLGYNNAAPCGRDARDTREVCRGILEFASLRRFDVRSLLANSRMSSESFLMKSRIA